MRLKLVPEITHWNFFHYTKYTVGASVLGVVASIVLLFVMGLNYGIDFRGGTTIRTESAIAVDVGAYRKAIAPMRLGDVTITEVFDPGFGPTENVTMIRIQAQKGQESVSADTVAAVEKALRAAVDRPWPSPPSRASGPRCRAS